MKHSSLMRTSAFVIGVLMLLLTLRLYAQNDLGIPNLGTSETHDYDTINLQNLNVSINIPLRTKTAGAKTSFSISANNNKYSQSPNPFTGGF